MYNPKVLASMDREAVDKLFFEGKISITDIAAMHRCKMQQAKEESDRKFEQLHKENRRKIEDLHEKNKKEFEKACESLETFKKAVATQSDRIKAASLRVEKGYNEAIEEHKKIQKEIKEERLAIITAIILSKIL